MTLQTHPRPIPDRPAAATAGLDQYDLARPDGLLEPAAARAFVRALVADLARGWDARRTLGPGGLTGT